MNLETFGIPPRKYVEYMILVIGVFHGNLDHSCAVILDHHLELIFDSSDFSIDNCFIKERFVKGARQVVKSCFKTRICHIEIKCCPFEFSVCIGIATVCSYVFT